MILLCQSETRILLDSEVMCNLKNVNYSLSNTGLRDASASKNLTLLIMLILLTLLTMLTLLTLLTILTLLTLLTLLMLLTLHTLSIDIVVLI